jgi:hypothetical protein
MSYFCLSHLFRTCEFADYRHVTYTQSVICDAYDSPLDVDRTGAE